LDTPYTVHHTNLFWNELGPPGSPTRELELGPPGSLSCSIVTPHLPIISFVCKHTCDLLLDSWWMKTALPAATYTHTRSTGSVMVTAYKKIKELPSDRTVAK